MLTADELKAAKRYLRVEGDEDDEVVTACVLAAREYLHNAGVALPAASTPRRAQYDLVCHARVLSAYEKRDPVITGTVVAQNPILREMLTQLKLTEPQAAVED